VVWMTLGRADPPDWPAGAMCVQRLDDSLEACDSHYVSPFAAFFIDAGAKRSIVESCVLAFSGVRGFGMRVVSPAGTPPPPEGRPARHIWHVE
jgi:hypothetical protein